MYTDLPGIKTYETTSEITKKLKKQASVFGMLTAKTGWANKRITIYNEDHFKDIFGEPDENNYKNWFNIYNYFQYNHSEPIDLIRVLDTRTETANLATKNYGYKLSSGSLDQTSASGLYNYDKALLTLGDATSETGLDSNTKFKIFNKFVTKETDVAFSICSDETNYKLPITNEKVDNVIIEHILYTETTGNTEELEAIHTRIENEKIVPKSNLLFENTSAAYKIQIVDFEKEKITSIRTKLVNGEPHTEIIIPGEYNIGAGSEIILSGNKLIKGKYNLLSSEPVVLSGGFTTITLKDNLVIYSSEYGNINFLYPTTLSTNGPQDAEEYYFFETNSIKKYSISSNAFEYTKQSEYKLIYKNDIYRKVFDDAVQNPYTGIVNTYFNILNEDIDFENKFILFIYKRVNNEFSIKEKYILNKKYENKSNNFAEEIVNNNSSLVYFKFNYDFTTDNINEPINMMEYSTNDNSILDLIFTDNESTLPDYTHYNDYDLFYDLSKELLNNSISSYYYLMPIELIKTFSSGNSYLSLNLMPTLSDMMKNSSCIITPFDSGMNTHRDLIENFGKSSITRYFNKQSSYNILYNNMKLQKDNYATKYRWLPLSGDIIGILTEIDKISRCKSPAGYKTPPILNCEKLLIEYNNDELREQVYNSINNIKYNEENNNYYLFDVMTSAGIGDYSDKFYIRRVLNYIKKELFFKLRKNIFELNSDFLITNIKNDCEDILAPLLSDEYISDRKIEIIRTGIDTISVNIIIIVQGVIRNIVVNINTNSIEINGE